MAAAIGVRSDYTSADLRQFARRSGDANQVRRLLAVALILRPDLDSQEPPEQPLVETDHQLIFFD